MSQNPSVFQTSQAMPFLSASTLVERGFKVFPLVHGGKSPAVENGFKQATADADRISGWARTMPWANIAIATGLHGDFNFFVVDVDVKGGAKGMESLDSLRKEIFLPESYNFV